MSATVSASPLWGRVLDTAKRRPLATDALLAAMFCALIIMSMTLGWWLRGPDQRDVAMWAPPLAVLSMAPIAARRVRPEAQFLVTTFVYLIAAAGNVPDDVVGIIAIWVSLYSVGVYGGGSRNPVRALGTATVLAALAWWLWTDSSADIAAARGPAFAYSMALSAGLIASAWLLGDTARIRLAQAADLAQRAAELEIERDLNAASAVTQERVRIARELHDVLAHHVTVIGVQAAAAERVLDRDPGLAKKALAGIATASRETVDELQRLLGFLRSDGDPSAGDPAPPQPALSQVGRLVADARSAGQLVDLHADGDLEALPGSVSLSAFRIVQEALTNARRHAPGAPVTVQISVRQGLVHLAVENGRPLTAPMAVGSSTAHGLVGMRERVRLVGGDLAYGPTDDGGWRVVATLPLMAASIP